MTKQPASSVGGIYFCYAQPKAVIRCLSAFRDLYPDVDIALISDGGMDFQHVARHFRCSYHHDAHHPACYESAPFNLDGAEAILRRLWIGMKAVEHRWIILLEDDVRVERPINIERLHSTLNGHNLYGGLPLPLTVALRVKNRAVFLPIQPTSAFGGAIFDREFFLRVGLASMLHACRSLAPLLSAVCPQLYPDCLITAVVLHLGGTVGTWSGYCEAWWNEYPFCRHFQTIEVLHAYKVWYNRPLSGPEANILSGAAVRVSEAATDWYDELERHYTQLESICCHAVVMTRAAVDGNIVSERFVRSASLSDRAERLRRLAAQASRCLDIGFNAGHSAVLMLLSSPAVTVLSFDLGIQPYAQQCADYVARSFPGRFEVVWGDTRETLRRRLGTEPDHRFDLVFIDGGNSAETRRSNMQDCRRVAAVGSVVIHCAATRDGVEAILQAGAGILQAPAEGGALSDGLLVSRYMAAP